MATPLVLLPWQQAICFLRFRLVAPSNKYWFIHSVSWVTVCSLSYRLISYRSSLPVFGADLWFLWLCVCFYKLPYIYSLSVGNHGQFYFLSVVSSERVLLYFNISTILDFSCCPLQQGIPFPVYFGLIFWDPLLVLLFQLFQLLPLATSNWSIDKVYNLLSYHNNSISCLCQWAQIASSITYI